MIFTDTLTDKALADLVRGIQANGFTSFATQPTGQAADKGLLVYHVAFNAPGSGWTLREIAALRMGDGEYQIQGKNVITGVSFFDALHMAAQKFQGRLSLGHCVQDDDTIKKALACDHLMDFRDAAQKSGQPLDHQGLPLASAGGHILVAGMYDNTALQIARTTEGRAMRAVMPLQANFSEIMGAHASSFAAQGEAGLPPRLVAKFSTALGAKSKMIDFMHGFVNGDYKRDWSDDDMSLRREDHYLVGGLSLGAVGGGVLPPLAGMWFLFAVEPMTAIVCGVIGGAAGAAAGLHASSEENLFKRHLAGLKRKAKALPEGAQKQMLNEFAQWSQAVFYLERAAYFHYKYQRDLSKTGYFRKAVRDARKGLEILGTSAEQIAAVEEGIKNGKFPSVGHFCDKLEVMSQRWTEPKQKLTARAASPALALTA